MIFKEILVKEQTLSMRNDLRTICLIVFIHIGLLCIGQIDTTAVINKAKVYRVIDTETQKPLPDCVIYTDGQLSLSNESGRFIMDFKDSVVIQHLGYRTAVFHNHTGIYQLQKLSVDLEEIVIVSSSYDEILFSALQSLKQSMDEFLETNNTYKYQHWHDEYDMTALIAINPNFKLGEFEVYNAAFNWKNSQLDTLKSRPLTLLTYSLNIWPSLNLKSKFYSRRHAEKKYKILNVETVQSNNSLIYNVRYKKYFIKFEIDRNHRRVDIKNYYESDYTKLNSHLTFENEIPTSINAWGQAESKWNWELRPIVNLSFVQSSNKYHGTTTLKDLKFDRLNLIE